MGWKAAPFTLLILFSGAATAYFCACPPRWGRPLCALQITECISPERGYSL